MTGVDSVVGDMCMHDLTTLIADRSEIVPAKKPTQFMGNGNFVLNELSTRCDKTHAHQLLMGGRASKAQSYNYELCRAMCRGLSEQKVYDRSGKACTGTLRRQAPKCLSPLSDAGRSPPASPARLFPRFPPPHLLALCSGRRSAAGRSESRAGGMCSPPHQLAICSVR